MSVERLSGVRETPLYRRVLGDGFDRLPLLVRMLHDLDGTAVWTGRADVERGNHPLCRTIAKLSRLPPTGTQQPLAVTFTPIKGAEHWRRDFDGRVFSSVQTQGDGVIHERVGLSGITLVPHANEAGLFFSVSRLTVLGLAMPRRLVPIVETREYEADGRYRFEVDAKLQRFGRLVRYAGWLEPAIASTSATRP